MSPMRSVAKCSAVALLALLCCASCVVPAAAQGSTTSPSRTLRFLQSFPRTIPELASIWTGANYCIWDGVKCDDEVAGTGVRVSLSGRGLTGRTPDTPNGNDAISVVAIDLSNNAQLGGGFQDSWAALTQLQTLDLSNTAIFGSIPDAWNSMQALQKVHISNTGACRSVPNWNSTSMAFLEEVDFSNNNLRVLSNDFGSFSNSSSLKSLNLDGNRFCFCLPDKWTSPLLRNAAGRATPAVLDADCGRTNQCVDGEMKRCERNGAAGLSSVFSAVCVMAIAASLILA